MARSGMTDRTPARDRPDALGHADGTAASRGARPKASAISGSISRAARFTCCCRSQSSSGCSSCGRACRSMDEYIRVMKGLWTEDSFSLDGEFYKVEAGRLPIKTVRKPYPTIYAASRTGIGKEVVARECDVWFVPYEPSHRLYEDNVRGLEREVRAMAERSRSYGREIRYGISAHVICEATRDFAEAKADALEEYGKKDPISAVAAKALGAGLVGTPREIAARLRRYEEIGIDTFMLHYHPMMEGLETFAAEVIPLLPSIARKAGEPRSSDLP